MLTKNYNTLLGPTPYFDVCFVDLCFNFCFSASDCYYIIILTLVLFSLFFSLVRVTGLCHSRNRPSWR